MCGTCSCDFKRCIWYTKLTNYVKDNEGTHFTVILLGTSVYYCLSGYSNIELDDSISYNMVLKSR